MELYLTKGLLKILKRPKGINIFVKSTLNYLKKILVLSVACDGVCLTLISLNQN